MAVVYSWDCRTVDTYPTHTDDNDVTATDVVFNVHWRLTGTEGDHSATSIGTQTLDTADLSSFTAFDDVTHTDMIGWVEDAIGTDEVAAIKAGISTQITELATPTTVTRQIVDAAE